MESRVKTWMRVVSRTAAVLLLVLAIGVTRNARSQEETKPEEGAPTVKIFVGPIDGAPGKARIGLVTEAEEFLCYVCSQDEGFNKSHSRWLKGKLAKDGVIEAESDNVKMKATVKGDKAEGTLTAADGKAMKFTAEQVPVACSAGIYRAEGAVDGEETVAGWIVDKEDTITGAALNKAKKQIGTLPAPKQGDNLNIQGKKGNPIQGQKVNSAKGATGTGKPVKLDPQAKAALLQETIGRLKKKGGSSLQAAFLNQLRRFKGGSKAASPLEEKTFAILSKTNRKQLDKYLDTWDKLPANSRNAILGASADLASGKEALTAEVLKKSVAGRLPKLAAPSSKAGAGAPKFKSIQVRELKCVDETDPEIIGSDEIFVIYTVAMGPTIFDPKQTTVHKGLNDNNTQPFNAADAAVFPPAGQSVQVTADVEITAGIFEDDSEEIGPITDFLKAAAAVGIEIFKFVTAAQGGAAPDTADLQQSINDFFDALAAALPTTNFLGSDKVIARTNGTLSKNVFTVRKAAGAVGLGEFHYELRDIRLNP